MTTPNLQALKYFFLFFTSEPSSLLSVPFLGREHVPAACPLLAISHDFAGFHSVALPPNQIHRLNHNFFLFVLLRMLPYSVSSVPRLTFELQA